MALRSAFIALFVAVAAHAALALTHGPAEALHTAIELMALGLLAARAITTRRNRAAWALLSAGIGAWIAGDLAYGRHAIVLADALYAGMFATFYVALGLLLRDRIRPFPSWLAVDGVLAGLALGALAALVFPHLDASPGIAVMTLGNLLCDVLLLVLVLVAFTATGWRPGRGWWTLGASLVIVTVADSIYATQRDDHAAWLDSLWCLAVALGALAAWQRTSRPSRPHVGWAIALVPVGGSAVGIATMLYGGLTHGNPLSLILAAGSLVAALLRALLMLRENMRLLAKARRQALTDKLTELPNRRALIDDLEQATATGKPHTLVFFDLDGFKDYNDSFGHPAGDALLKRLAPRLAALGRAYRLGGDEFCLLVKGALSDDHATITGAVQALSEHGDGFTISASHGLVVLPYDAQDATEALRLADERMYSRKRRRRNGSRDQASDILIKVLAERNGERDNVVELATAVGHALGLDAEELDVLMRAAELHDVGTVAVPDGILYKQGPLDPAEWEIMRQHTVAGERILGATESMRPVARLVRAAHERWDGLGYPDGLRGDEIPLGARIICACDAYDAMVRGAPYRTALSAAAALAELRRCAGTQFDPRVVETLTQLCQGSATLAASGRAHDQRGS